MLHFSSWKMLLLSCQQASQSLLRSFLSTCDFRSPSFSLKLSLVPATPRVLRSHLSSCLSHCVAASCLTGQHICLDHQPLEGEAQVYQIYVPDRCSVPLYVLPGRWTYPTTGGEILGPVRLISLHKVGAADPTNQLDPSNPSQQEPQDRGQWFVRAGRGRCGPLPVAFFCSLRLGGWGS